MGDDWLDGDRGRSRGRLRHRVRAASRWSRSGWTASSNWRRPASSSGGCRTELRFGREVSEGAERIARRIAGVPAVRPGTPMSSRRPARACGAAGARRSPGPDLPIALLSIPIMLVLARRKLALADQLGSAALRADAAESVACLWLSLVVVIGLLAQLALRAWWIDAATSLAIVWFLFKEGREAWEAEEDD